MVQEIGITVFWKRKHEDFASVIAVTFVAKSYRHTHMHKHTYLHKYTHICMNARTNTHKHKSGTYTCINTYTHMHADIPTYTPTPPFIYLHTFTHSHTNLHTDTNACIHLPKHEHTYLHSYIHIPNHTIECVYWDPKAIFKSGFRKYESIPINLINTALKPSKMGTVLIWATEPSAKEMSLKILWLLWTMGTNVPYYV